MPRSLKELMQDNTVLAARNESKKKLKPRPVIVDTLVVHKDPEKQLPGQKPYRQNRRLTEKQRKFLLAWKEGHNLKESYKIAGYKVNEKLAKANPLIHSPVVRSAVESYVDQLKQRGVSLDFLAEKMKEWLDAKKGHVLKDGTVVETPDYMAQLKAYEQMKDVFNISGKNQKAPGQGRKVTVEEWINE